MNDETYDKIVEDIKLLYSAGSSVDNTHGYITYKYPIQVAVETIQSCYYIFQLKDFKPKKGSWAH